MNDEKQYMIDVKVKRYAWKTRSSTDDPLNIINRNDDNVEIRNLLCDENAKEELLKIVTDNLPELDWIVATIKTGG